MKTFKKALAVVLCVVMTLTAAPLGGLVGMELPSLFDFEAEAATISSYSQGDIIEFGWYPQSEVTDSDIIAALNSACGEWISYGYYSGAGYVSDGKMKAGDYMRYKDVIYGSDKYRGVIFDTYRPYYTGYKTSTSTQYTYQYDNGYICGKVYWFKYEPVKWRVLDPNNGVVMAETILDAQPYNNYVYLGYEGDAYSYTIHWGNFSRTYYANNYAESSIRKWLNDDFYNTTFSSAQQCIINYAYLDNSAYNSSHSAYRSVATNDKIYLLSYHDMRHTAYGFSSSSEDEDTARRAQGSDYAKCQGLVVSKGIGYEGNSSWWLRSAGSLNNAATHVYQYGSLGSFGYTYTTSNGIRPTLNLNLYSEIFQSDIKDMGASLPYEHTPGEWEIKTEPTCTDEGVSVKKCTVCQAELETRPIELNEHTPGDWEITTNPTTTAEGEKTLYCATCNEPLETAIVPMLDAACDYLEWEVNEDNTVTITDCDSAYSGEITIPASISELPVTAIGSSAFSNCDNITKITIPATVTSIKDEEYSTVGFHTCDNLESIVVDEANEKYSSENGVLYNKDKTKLISVPAKAIDGEFVIPSTVTTVSRYAFDAHNGIKLTLSDNLSSVNWNNIKAKEFVASDNCKNYSTVDGVLFNKAKTTLYRFPIASDITEYDVPEGVKLIYDYAFYKSSIKQVTIPSSVNFINSMAFSDCSQLERVDHACLICWCKYINFESFSSNPLSNGAALYIDDTLVDDLYYNNEPNDDFHEEGAHVGTVDVIRDYAFYGYEHFRSLTLPETVSAIGTQAFKLCKNLKLLTVLGNVTDWGTQAFYNCPDLYTVQFAEGATKIGAEAFWGCDNLQQLYIPSTMTYIGNGAFYGYSGQTIDKICFGGTSSQWSKIDKTANNFRISNSTISYHKHTTSSATKLVDVVNPTCTEAGYSGDRKNSSCLMYTSLGKVVPATGHKPGEWETKVEPGCVSEGTKVKKCTVCKEEVETDTIPVTGHDYKAVVTKPTCTVDGYTTHTCSVCKDTYTDSVVKAEGHKYDSVVTPNTCTKDGYTTHTCSVCEDTYTDSETKATGHSHESKVTKEPTCTNTGIRTFTCHCGDSYTEVIKANGHTKGEWEYIGGKEYAKSCTVCGDKLESKIVTVDMFFNGENVNEKQVLNKSTATVTATVTDNFVNDLVFASSDNSTVSVDANGNVVANNIGKATITVTIKGTAISDSIEVEVLPRDFTITWIVNGKETTQTVKEYAEIVPNVNTKVNGYMFKGWDSKVPSTMPSENLTFTAVLEKIVPTTVKVSKAPSKTGYVYKQDKLDLSGIELQVTYSDGTKKIVKDTSKMKATGFANDKNGEQTVTIEYEGLKADFKVTVKYTWWQWILIILLFGWIWY